MLVDKGSLEEAYSAIKGDAANKACTVVIFVSPEADSLCACKILATLFKSDSIGFTIRPVSGYDEIRQAYEELTREDEGADLRSLVMVNCGGTVDLVDFFTLEDDKRAVYVIDAHRPYNLSNVRQHNNHVRILDEGTAVGAPPMVYPDEAGDDDDLSDYEEESDNDDDDEEELSAKRRRREVAEADPVKRERMAKKKLVDEYYQETFYGCGASVLALELARQLNKDDNDMVWWAIIGLTDQFVHEHIDVPKYTLLLDYFIEMVDRLNPKDREDEEYVAKLQNDALVKRHGVGYISSLEEYRFVLLRHWSLYQAMQHSQYVATRLGIWKEGGSRKLQTLLTKMGIPLAECKRAFSYMTPEFTSKLREKLEEYGHNYGLNDLTYPSFQRQHSYNFQISAADMVHALSALLEQPTKGLGDSTSLSTSISHYDGKQGSQGEEDDAYLKMLDEEGKATWEEEEEVELRGKEGKSSEEDKPIFNFWNAYEALSGGEWSNRMLKRGICISIALQRAIVHTGVSVLTKKILVTTGPFRYCMLEEDQFPQIGIFAQPLALGKLAFFIAEALLETWKRKYKPLVVAAYNPQRLTYLVVGINGSLRAGLSARNRFGIAFRKTADKVQGCRFKHDGFETAFIEVQKDYIRHFLSCLHTGVVEL